MPSGFPAQNPLPGSCVVVVVVVVVVGFEEVGGPGLGVVVGGSVGISRMQNQVIKIWY